MTSLEGSYYLVYPDDDISILYHTDDWGRGALIDMNAGCLTW